MGKFQDENIIILKSLGYHLKVIRQEKTVEVIQILKTESETSQY